jgi:DNA-binding XRE family transcriptional regulator
LLQARRGYRTASWFHQEESEDAVKRDGNGNKANAGGLKMTGKRTAYTFNVKSESTAFRKAYQGEVSRLKLAHRIAELREKSGLTQAELARRVGTTQAGISRLENPNYRNYSLTTLEKVAHALGARLKVELEEKQRAA